VVLGNVIRRGGVSETARQGSLATTVVAFLQQDGLGGLWRRNCRGGVLNMPRVVFGHEPLQSSLLIRQQERRRAHRPARTPADCPAQIGCPEETDP
jgi:hypothetical protein